MPGQRKLGRRTDQRNAILRNLVTALLTSGKIETTEARAKEVKSIAEKLITVAKREMDNFTSKEKKVSSAKTDKKGNKVLVTAKSKNGNKYEKVERITEMEMVAVDEPSRLKARRLILQKVYRFRDKTGERLNVVNKLFDDIAPKYKDRNGGYTKMHKLGPRRGDAAEMVLLELV
jgi:large subunit ribosomal protein L17